MKMGFLRSNAKRDLEIYEYYEEESLKVGSMQAITNAADKFCISEESIKKVIYRIRPLVIFSTNKEEKGNIILHHNPI